MSVASAGLAGEIVVVGGGPSLLGRGLGPLVDSALAVVRVNHCPTHPPYDRDTGVRCDVWAASVWRGMPEVYPLQGGKRDPGLGKLLLLAYPVKEPQDHLAQARDIARQYPDISHVERPERIAARCQAMGFADWVECWPTSGAMAVAIMLEHYPRVHVLGFDHLKGAEGGVRHYYDRGQPGPPNTGYHSHALERAYFERLMAQGKVIKL